MERAEKAERKETPSPPVAATAPTLVDRLALEDVNAICGLFKRVWEPYLTGLPADVQKQWMLSPLEFTSGMEGITYFAARRGERIVGVVGCEAADGAVHLVNLAVEPEVRRQGVGTSLLNTALEWARRTGARSVWMDAPARFHEIRPLLRHLEFQETGVLHQHYWGDDVEFFEKVL